MKYLILALFLIHINVFAQIYAQSKNGDTYVTLNSPEHIKQLCDQHFVGTFYWNSIFGDMCVHDLAGVTINKDILDFAISISKTYRETARAILQIAADKSIESKTFQYVLNHLVGNTGIALQNTHIYIAAIAGARFDTEYLGMCQSRTALASMVNPVASSRTLNIKNILTCIYTLRDVQDVGLGTSLSLTKCKLIPTLTARLSCLTPVVEKWREKEKNRKNLSDKFKNYLDSILKDDE